MSAETIEIDLKKPMTSIARAIVEAIMAQDMPMLIDLKVYMGANLPFDDNEEVDMPNQNDLIGRGLKVLAGYLLMSSIDGKHVKDFVLNSTGNGVGIDEYTTSLS